MTRIIRLVLVLAMPIIVVTTGSSQVTTNVLTRVFNIRYKDRIGSSFTIEVQNRQYLITARHLVEGIKNGENVDIRQNQEWKSLTFRVLTVQPPEVDIIVLVPPTQISLTFPLEPTTQGLLLGQNMYFLGFPFGLYMETGKLNDRVTIPLVKGGIFSGIFTTPSTDYGIIMVDGMNNPGFSGGPIVFVDQSTKELKVAGVVRGYRFEETQVFRRVPKKKPTDKDRLVRTDMVVESNTGIVIGYDIRNAVDAILKNPTGPLVKN